jgi:hypothetical protein
LQAALAAPRAYGRRVRQQRGVGGLCRLQRTKPLPEDGMERVELV